MLRSNSKLYLSSGSGTVSSSSKLVISSKRADVLEADISVSNNHYYGKFFLVPASISKVFNILFADVRHIIDKSFTNRVNRCFDLIICNFIWSTRMKNHQNEFTISWTRMWWIVLILALIWSRSTSFSLLENEWKITRTKFTKLIPSIGLPNHNSSLSEKPPVRILSNHFRHCSILRSLGQEWDKPNQSELWFDHVNFV